MLRMSVKLSAKSGINLRLRHDLQLDWFFVDTESQLKYNLRNPLGWTTLKLEDCQGGQPEMDRNSRSGKATRTGSILWGRGDRSYKPANCGFRSEANLGDSRP